MRKIDQKMSNIDNSDFSLYYVSPPRKQPGLLPLHFDMVGDEQCASTYRVYRTRAELSVLICVLSGSAKAFTQDNSWELAREISSPFPKAQAMGIRP